MNSRLFSLFFTFFIAISGFFTFLPEANAAEQRIVLPKPKMRGGKPLLDTLSQRHSTRIFSNQALNEQELSDLLWATWGINRPNGGRTAPSSKDVQDVIVFVALEKGVWRYEAKSNELILVLDANVLQMFGGAPVTLLYAAPGNLPTSGMHVGAIFQNAALFCTSYGLGNIVKSAGANALDSQLKLPKTYTVSAAHSIGWPK